MCKLLSFLVILLFYFRFVLTAEQIWNHRPNRTEAISLLSRIVELKDTLNDIASPYIKITFSDVPQNCIQMQCKVICFNGQSQNIEKDIQRITSTTQYNCKILDELRLYNYEFPKTIIPRNFLGNYTDKIISLYLANSNVTDYEDGAFGFGIFQTLTLENLRLLCLRRGFFKHINQRIESLIIVQKETAFVTICANTFNDVMYRLKFLSLEVGISCIRNITATNGLFNKLAHVDFSYNDLGDSLRSDAFNTLSRVEHLDLSYSNIQFLPEFIFHQMSTLEYLDLSHNHLKIITANIFGLHEMPSELKIQLNHNDWHCTCDLKRQMQIFYGKQSPIISCESPEENAGWSVFDERLCGENENYESTTSLTPIMTTSPKTTTFIWSTTRANKPIDSTTWSSGSNVGVAEVVASTTTGRPLLSTSTTKKMPFPNSLIDLKCKRQSPLERLNHKVIGASMDFTVRSVPNLSVDVVLTVSDVTNDAYGLIWFSNVTKDYYKMEVNYKEYGLGCFGTIYSWTTVDKLLPNVSYTFCLIQRDRLTVSPFNCRSVHIPSNLGVRYNAWLTHDSRSTGISLFILGIVIFTFIGILIIFTVLKNKPILLKGSKRVVCATTKDGNNEIVVLPKDRTLEELRYKEEMLAKRNSKSIINTQLTQRRGSNASNASYTSYMNANLYEEVPAYFKIKPNLSLDHFATNTTEQEKVEEHNYNYIQPALIINSNEADLVSYAEIPFRHKRTSNDPLPAVPIEKDKPEEAQENCKQTFPMLESDINLSSIYFTFTHDSPV